VFNETQFESEFGNGQLIEGRALRLLPCEDLPDVPALPETLLLLDLMVHEPCVDLSEMSALVLGDLGATLQVLRLAGREYADAEDRPTRIVDCISDLGIEACVEAISARTVHRDARKEAIAAFWSYSREVAEYSKQGAEEMFGVNPEDAYLAGLLHGIGSLPAILGWESKDAGLRDSATAGLHLARNWALPECVLELLFEIQFAELTARHAGLTQPGRPSGMSSLN
jgi:HD-like signal output (HDOD) protein